MADSSNEGYGWSVEKTTPKALLFLNGVIGGGKTSIKRLIAETMSEISSNRVMICDEVDTKSSMIEAFYSQFCSRAEFQLDCTAHYIRQKIRIQRAMGFRECEPDAPLPADAPTFIVSDRGLDDTAVFAMNLSENPTQYEYADQTSNDVLRSLVAYSFHHSKNLKNVAMRRGYRVINIFVDASDKCVADRVIQRNRTGERDVFEYDPSDPKSLEATLGVQINNGLRKAFSSGGYSDPPGVEKYYMRNESTSAEALRSLFYCILYAPASICLTSLNTSMPAKIWNTVLPWVTNSWLLIACDLYFNVKKDDDEEQKGDGLKNGDGDQEKAAVIVSVRPSHSYVDATASSAAQPSPFVTNAAAGNELVAAAAAVVTALSTTKDALDYSHN